MTAFINLATRTFPYFRSGAMVRAIFLLRLMVTWVSWRRILSAVDASPPPRTCQASLAQYDTECPEGLLHVLHEAPLPSAPEGCAPLLECRRSPPYRLKDARVQFSAERSSVFWESSCPL